MSIANGVQHVLQEGEGGGEGGAAGGGAGAGGAGGGGAAGGGGGGAGSGAASAWHGLDATKDADAVSYIENKGWKSPADVVASYRGVEKFVGRDPSTLAVIPRADDVEGTRALLGRLGMPAEAKGYEIDSPKDLQADPAFQDFIRGAFHKAGLTAAQAKNLSADYNNFLREQAKQVAKDYDLNSEADRKTLEKEWGAGFDRMVNRGKLAAEQLGFSGEVVDAIEEKIGFAATMKLFAEIGGKLGEASFVGSDSGGAPRFSGAMTPAEAQQEWNNAKMDPNFIKALQDTSNPGHAAAKEKQTKLFKIMYPS